MRIEEWDIKRLTPYERNAKKHSAEQVANVANSIKRFGWQQPIVVDESGCVVIGHCRLLAAKKMRLKTVPVTVASGLTEEEIRELRIADNKVNESEWDKNLLAAEIMDLKWDGFNFEFALPEETKEAAEDDYDEPAPETAKTPPGSVWQLGRHRLMCGDSTRVDDVYKLMGGQMADMLLTDPPYNVNYEGTAGKIENDNIEDAAFRAFLTDAFTNARLNMKPGAAFHIWHADSEGYNFRGACRDSGLLVRQCLIWVKNSLVLGRQDFQWKHEPCLYGEKPVPYPEIIEGEHMPCLYGWVDGKHYWAKNRKQTTILEFERPTKSKHHPTMKPVKLFDYQMQCNTRPGAIVLDLFAGSGTSIIAAEQNDRSAYVMEYDPKYADVIIDRWERLTGQKAEKISD